MIEKPIEKPASKGRGPSWDADENLRAVKAGVYVSADSTTGADNSSSTLHEKVKPNKHICTFSLLFSFSERLIDAFCWK